LVIINFINIHALSFVPGDSDLNSYMTKPSGPFLIQPSMPPVDIVHHVKHLADGSSYGIGLADELPVISYMCIKVVKKFLWNINTYFWHCSHLKDGK